MNRPLFYFEGRSKVKYEKHTKYVNSEFININNGSGTQNKKEIVLNIND